MASPSVPTTFANTPSPASVALLDGNFGFVQGAAPFWGLDNFGAKGDGVTDDSAAVNAWLAQLAANGGVGVMTSGKTYYCASQAVLDLTRSPAPANILIFAYGAVITTGVQPIYGLKILGDNIPNRQTVMGLTVNQRGSGGAGTGTNGALGGFGLSGTGSVSLMDCTVVANGVPFAGNPQTDYAAIDLFQTDPTNTATGCFWTEIYRCWVRKESGTDVGDIPYGVRLRGAANSTRIHKCQFSTQSSVFNGSVTSAILLTNHLNQSVVPNGVVLCFNDYEGCAYATLASVPSGSKLEGFESFSDRFEAVFSSAFFFTGTLTSANVPPQIWGGYPLFTSTGFSGTGVFSNSNTITSVNSNSWSNLIVGQNLVGTGLPTGVVVTGFNQVSQTISLSAATTSTGSGIPISSQVMWISNPNNISINNLTPDSNNVPGAQWAVTNFNGTYLSALSGSAHTLNLGITANSNRGIYAYDTGAGAVAQFYLLSNEWGTGYNSFDIQAGTGASPRDLRLRSPYNIILNGTSDRSNYSQGHIVFGDYNGGVGSQFGHMWMDASGALSYTTQATYVSNLGSDSPPNRVRLQTSANGTTRPAAPIAGQAFFDSSLAVPRPIWCKSATGPVWVDATGGHGLKLRNAIWVPMTKLYLSSLSAESGRVPSLDGLRAVSVFLVLIQHIVSDMFPGGYGVWVFFFISGFLISRMMFEEHKLSGKIDIRYFYVKRFFRLYPVILIYTILVITVFAWKINIDWREPLSVLTYWANYLASSKDPLQMPFTVFWSLSIEEQFYIIFPLIFILISGNPKKMVILCIFLIAVALFIRYIGAIRNPNLLKSHWFYFRTEFRFDAIAFGVLLAALCEFDQGKNIVKTLAGRLPFALACVIILICVAIRDPFFKVTICYSIIDSCLLSVVAGVVFAAPFKIINIVLNSKILVFFGNISYSLYVWHIGVRDVVDRVFNGSPPFVRISLSFVFAIVVAVISFTLIERPILKFRDNLARTN